MNRVDSGLLPKQHSMEELFPGRVVTCDRVPRDKSVNDTIQEEGGHFRPCSGSEASWYRKNKGYTERLFGE